VIRIIKVEFDNSVPSFPNVTRAIA